IGPFLGVRQPLLAGVSRGLRAALRRDGATTVLDVAAALQREPLAELRWLGIDLLERTIAAEPELTWQLVRAQSRRAQEWATVDSLVKLPPAVAQELRDTLAGIRRHAGDPSTSRAGATAAGFAGFGVEVPPAERASVDRI